MQLEVDSTHPALGQFGFKPETWQHFEAGVCITEGMLQDQIVVPFHTEGGVPIGYGSYHLEMGKWIYFQGSAGVVFNLGPFRGERNDRRGAVGNPD